MGSYHYIHGLHIAIRTSQEMLQRPDFLENCELWRSEERDPDVFIDVYDEEIWKEFL